MAQHGIDQDFHRMTIHDSRKQLSPTIARKPQLTSAVYRAGPAPYRGYHEGKQEDFPPPPPSQSYLENFPPPPPEPKENIYHEIQDDFPPPPPTTAPGDYRSPDPVHMRSSSGYNQTAYGGPGGSSYESRHESHSVIQPSGRYEREVKQATYSIQSSDSSGRSSPYGSHYGNLNTYSTSNMANNPPPPPVTQPYLSTSEAQPYSTTSLYERPISGQYGSGSYSQDGHITYAQIQPDPNSRSEPAGVTYAQIVPRADRPVPGPQVPIQIKVSDSRRSEPVYPASGQVQYQPANMSPSRQQYAASTGPPSGQQYAASTGPPSGQQYASSTGPTSGQQYAASTGPPSGQQYAASTGPSSGQQYASSTGPSSGQQYASSTGPPSGQQYASSTGPSSGQQYAASSGPMYSQSTPLYPQHKSPYAGGSEAKPVSSNEEQVDALTQMLMQGLEGTKDPDFYGVCSKCGKKVVGETNGCTAMDQVFHIACFICVGCGKLLRGESFYAMERKPFCEPCYVNSLERCSVCSKPITDRLLRATGKPYHPACFTCVVCGKSLDGIPFTVDATNQIHCIEDFHKKFAPRCCVCHNPIMPDKGQEETVRVVAMDRSFHVGCYRCEDCHMQLSSEAEGRGCYPLDDHILCKGCNAKRINALTTKLSTEL